MASTQRVFAIVERIKKYGIIGNAMTQDILRDSAVFPVTPLILVYFGNRCAVVANLIRHLHNKVILENVSPEDTNRLMMQIGGLRDRLWHIGITRSLSTMAFVLALSAMIAAYFLLRG